MVIALLKFEEPIRSVSMLGASLYSIIARLLYKLEQRCLCKLKNVREYIFVQNENSKHVGENDGFPGGFYVKWYVYCFSWLLSVPIKVDILWVGRHLILLCDFLHCSRDYNIRNLYSNYHDLNIIVLTSILSGYILCIYYNIIIINIINQYYYCWEMSINIVLAAAN